MKLSQIIYKKSHKLLLCSHKRYYCRQDVFQIPKDENNFGKIIPFSATCMPTHGTSFDSGRHGTYNGLFCLLPSLSGNTAHERKQ